MRKRILAILISCTMLSAVALTGCDFDTADESNTTPTESTTAEATDNTTENTETPSETTSEQDATETAPTESESEPILVEDEDATFEYVDETVTNPTVAPIVIPEDDNTTRANITATTLAGNWKPLIALTVADGQERPFQEIFGSSFRDYGGSLVIAEDSTFTISMGAAIIRDKSMGTFTISQNNLLVTYADGSVDTYLYIPNYQNQQVIKTQIGEHYVYFAKE